MSKLTENNYALMRAAWTAMDQTYGQVLPGYHLQPINNGGWPFDNSGSPLKTIQPFTYPAADDYVVTDVIGSEMGGKFTIYKSIKANVVMVVPMGTNGNGDLVGWLTNFEDDGLQQWTSPVKPGVSSALSLDELTMPTTRDVVFSKLNTALRGMNNATVLFAGDSKGGALAQFALNDLLEGDVSNMPNLKLLRLQHDRLVLVTHSAPGVQDVLVKNNMYKPSDWMGIAANYTAAYLRADSTSSLQNVANSLTGQREAFTELITETGGAYANAGKTNFYTMPLDPAVPVWKVVQYAHRLTSSGWDYFTQAGGDFSSLVNQPSNKPMLNTKSMQALASFFASIGQTATVSQAEAVARIAAGASCSVAAAPAAIMYDLLNGDRPSIVSIAASLLQWAAPALPDTPVGLALDAAYAVSVVSCAGSLLASNVLKDGENGALFVTGTDNVEWVRKNVGAGNVLDGWKQTFVGQDDTGALLVYDMSTDASQAKMWGVKDNVRYSVLTGPSGMAWTFNNVGWTVDATGSCSILVNGKVLENLGVGYVAEPDFVQGCVRFTQRDAGGQQSSSKTYILTTQSSTEDPSWYQPGTTLISGTLGLASFTGESLSNSFVLQNANSVVVGSGDSSVSGGDYTHITGTTGTLTVDAGRGARIDAGATTATISAQDGDIISTSAGTGSISFHGKTLTGGKWDPDNNYYTDASGFVYQPNQDGTMTVYDTTSTGANGAASFIVLKNPPLQNNSDYLGPISAPWMGMSFTSDLVSSNTHFVQAECTYSYVWGQTQTGWQDVWGTDANGNAVVTGQEPVYTAVPQTTGTQTSPVANAPRFTDFVLSNMARGSAKIYLESAVNPNYDPASGASDTYWLELSDGSRYYLGSTSGYAPVPPRFITWADGSLTDCSGNPVTFDAPQNRNAMLPASSPVLTPSTSSVFTGGTYDYATNSYISTDGMYRYQLNGGGDLTVTDVASGAIRAVSPNFALNSATGQASGISLQDPIMDAAVSLAESLSSGMSDTQARQLIKGSTALGTPFEFVNHVVSALGLSAQYSVQAADTASVTVSTIQALQHAAAGAQLVTLNTLSAEQLAAAATADARYRTALEKLDPYVVLGSTGASPSQPAGPFDAAYLLDRAQFLLATLSGSTSESYFDFQTNTRITGTDDTASTVYFGGQTGDVDESGAAGTVTLYAGGTGETMYAGRSDATLYGGDNDMLVGGEGANTYYVAPGDTVKDANGTGVVYAVLNGATNAQVVQLTGGVWDASAGVFRGSYGETYQPEGPSTIQVFMPGAAQPITLQFAPGTLGVQLNGGPYHADGTYTDYSYNADGTVDATTVLLDGSVQVQTFASDRQTLLKSVLYGPAGSSDEVDFHADGTKTESVTSVEGVLTRTDYAVDGTVVKTTTVMLFGADAGNVECDPTAVEAVQLSAGVSPSDVTWTRRASGDLMLTIGSSTLTLHGYFNSSAQSPSLRLDFPDGSEATVAPTAAMLPITIGGQEGTISLTGVPQAGISFASDVAAAQLQVTHDLLGNVTMTVVDGTTTLQLSAGTPVPALTFSDGTQWPGDSVLSHGSVSATDASASDAETLMFAIGDGACLVNQAKQAGAAQNTLTFATGISPSDVHLVRQGDDLVVIVGTQGDKLTVPGYFTGGVQGQFAAFSFADGSQWSTVAVAEADASFVPNDGAQLAVLSSAAASRITVSVQFSPADLHVSVTSDGNLLLSAPGSVDSLTLLNWSNTGAAQNASVQFSDGTTWGYAELLHQLSLATQDYSSPDAQAVVFSTGDGLRTVTQHKPWGSTQNTLVLGAGVTADDVVFLDVGHDLVVKLRSGDQLTIPGYFSDYNSSNQFSRIQYGDGSTIAGTAMPVEVNSSDSVWNQWGYPYIDLGGEPATHPTTVLANTPNTYIWGGQGDITVHSTADNVGLSAGGGTNTFELGSGQNWNNFYDWRGGTGEHNFVQFDASVQKSDIKFQIQPWGSLAMTDTVTGGSLTLQNFMQSNMPLDGVNFADGTSMSLGDIRAQYASAPNADGTLQLADGQSYWGGATAGTVTGGASWGIVLKGSTAGDTLIGGSGFAGLFATAGDNVLELGAGGGYMYGGTGTDLLIGHAGAYAYAQGKQGVAQLLYGGNVGDNLNGRGVLIAGGDQSWLSVSGQSVMAFDKGDGAQTVYGLGQWSMQSDNSTISVGGGVEDGDIYLTRDGQNLVLHMGGADRITLGNWYPWDPQSPGATPHVNLQVIESAAADFDASSSDPLKSAKVQEFDLNAFAAAFDAAQAADSSVTQLTLSAAATKFLTSTTDTAAYGGDLAYYYATENNLGGLSADSARAVLKDAGFGGLQTLHDKNSLQQGSQLPSGH